MGIKGIYSEIGSGCRAALSRLAVEKLRAEGRPLRLAIDISIWQFQAQAGKGGRNSQLRTLYYRLVRLLRLSIQPVFVFDGPHRPPFKRNKRTSAYTVLDINAQAKQLMKLFGFPFVTAPGEAEAECTLLQRSGIVDAVMSEDVDTLMFGCSRLFRNWSGEGTGSSKTPTHVSVYDAADIKKGPSALDREGMVLIALMSGGDYIPAGISNCGIRVACEAARAGFGHDLFELDRNDKVGYAEWRERLQYELQTNTSGYFRTKHPSMAIPDTFPDRAVLYYYTNPIVSNTAQLERYRQEMQWRHDIDMPALRTFVADNFDWNYIGGAKHFIRGLAPAIIASRLASQRDQLPSDHTSSRKPLIKSIAPAVRTHASTDMMPELRVVFRPLDVVDVDLSQEPEESHTAAYCEEDDEEEVIAVEDDCSESAPSSPRKRRLPAAFDPGADHREWMAEDLVKIGLPELYKAWATPAMALKRMNGLQSQGNGRSKDGAQQHTLDAFVKITKKDTTQSLEVSPKSKTIESQPIITGSNLGKPSAKFRMPDLSFMAPPEPLAKAPELISLERDGPSSLGQSYTGQFKASRSKVTSRSYPSGQIPSKPSADPEVILINSSPTPATPPRNVVEIETNPDGDETIFRGSSKLSLANDEPATPVASISAIALGSSIRSAKPASPSAATVPSSPSVSASLRKSRKLRTPAPKMVLSGAALSDDAIKQTSQLSAAMSTSAKLGANPLTAAVHNKTQSGAAKPRNRKPLPESKSAVRPSASAQNSPRRHRGTWTRTTSDSQLRLGDVWHVLAEDGADGSSTKTKAPSQRDRDKTGVEIEVIDLT